MRILPFFILSLISCSLKDNSDKKTTLTIVDTIIPALDSGNPWVPAYNSYSESVYVRHQRDSFYAIKPAFLFTSTGQYAGFNKLVAAVIDTSAVLYQQYNFSISSTFKYNKDSTPLSKTYSYLNNQYKIEVIDISLEEYQPKKIAINGKLLKWGTDIDTTLTGSDISYDLEFNADDFRLIQFGQRKFLYLKGYIEKCNGMGCGVSYFLLYDPKLQKAIALQQFRISELYLGKCISSKDLVLLLFEDYDYNYQFGYFTVAAKAYTFLPNGKVLPATDKKGKPYYFDGYSINDPDSISILKANFPLR